MSVPLLDLVAQYREIKDDVLAAMMQVIERQSFIMGPEVPQLEAEIARLSHTKHGIACASGTDALLLPLKALDLEPGDEVITTPFTFFATAGTIHNAGGTPVFVDIDPATMNISPEAIEAAITPQTRAIIVVHLFGQMAAMESIMRIAARHGLPVIEDGAQSIGARRRIDGQWRMSGELGTVGTLSFFPTKNLGAWGDAGLIVTQDDKLAERLRRLRLHGGSRQYMHEEVGTNSRLDTLQAAVLLAKLPYLERWNQARERNAARYTEAFTGHPSVCPPRSIRPTTTSFISTPFASPSGMSCRLISRDRASVTPFTIHSHSTSSPALPIWGTAPGVCLLRRPLWTRYCPCRYIRS